MVSLVCAPRAFNSTVSSSITATSQHKSGLRCARQRTFLLLVSRITANFLFAKIYRPLTINWANLADRAYTTKPTFGLQATWIDAGFQGRWPEFIAVVRDKLEAAAREGVRRRCWSPRADPERFRA